MDTPVALCYSNLVSRDSTRIAFLVVALNDLDIFSCDIGNAFLNVPCQEKIWFQVGIECGQSAGWKVMKCVRALFGLKSSGTSWRKMSKDFIQSSLKFKSSHIDPDICYRRNTQKDGLVYYGLLLVYVDDILAISHDPEVTTKGIRTIFENKNKDYGLPTMYLGGDIGRFQLLTERVCGV